MPIPTITQSQCQAARTAGILYFLTALIAPIGLMYVPSKLIVTGDAAATLELYAIDSEAYISRARSLGWEPETAEFRARYLETVKRTNNQLKAGGENNYEN